VYDNSDCVDVRDLQGDTQKIRNTWPEQSFNGHLSFFNSLQIEG
jgi:hypothetical protein